MAVEQKTKVTGTSFFLFFLSLFITAYSARHPGLASTGSAVAIEIERPFQYVVGGTASFFGGLWRNYIGLVGLRDEYDQLESRAKSLEQDKSRLLELEQENQRLRKLLDSVSQSSLEVLVARVTGWDHSNWVQAISIDKGMRDGVQDGMAVITAEGVVGHIIAVALTSSRVLLITDHSSGIDALVQSNRARGIVEGSGQKSMEWRFVLQEDDIKVGDRLVTSGMDGVFPAGLFIGRVSEIDTGDSALFKDVEVTPAVNLGHLEEVMIVIGQKSTPVKREDVKKK